MDNTWMNEFDLPLIPGANEYVTRVETDQMLNKVNTEFNKVYGEHPLSKTSRVTFSDEIKIIHVP